MKPRRLMSHFDQSKDFEDFFVCSTSILQINSTTRAAAGTQKRDALQVSFSSLIIAVSTVLMHSISKEKET
jgi:uncharacterized membrane protein